MSKLFVGLDLSLTATGFCMIDQQNIVDNCEIKTKPEKFSSILERTDYIAHQILKKLEGKKIDFIAMQDYFSGRQPGSVIMLAILGTMVRLRLLENGYSFLAFAPTQIKKFETGKGTAPKDTMIKSVFKKHGLDTNSNNIADACAIAFTGKGYYDYVNKNRTDYTQYELEVLKKVIKERNVTQPYKKEF